MVLVEQRSKRLSAVCVYLFIQRNSKLDPRLSPLPPLSLRRAPLLNYKVGKEERAWRSRRERN